MHVHHQCMRLGPSSRPEGLPPACNVPHGNSLLDPQEVCSGGQVAAWCAHAPFSGVSVQHDEDLMEQHLDEGCRLLKESGLCCAQACPDPLAASLDALAPP